MQSAILKTQAIGLSATGGVPATPPSLTSTPGIHVGTASQRSDFAAAMRVARGGQDEVAPTSVVEASRSSNSGLSASEIGSGLQNVAKGFADHFAEHSSNGLKRVINADPANPAALLDIAAYEVNGSVGNLQFAVASKMTGQMSKSMDTLFKSS